MQFDEHAGGQLRIGAQGDQVPLLPLDDADIPDGGHETTPAEVEHDRREVARETCEYCGGNAIVGTTCPKGIVCPHCGAGVGQSCRRPSDHRAADVHAARVERAEQIDAMPPGWYRPDGTDWNTAGEQCAAIAAAKKVDRDA